MIIIIFLFNAPEISCDYENTLFIRPTVFNGKTFPSYCEKKRTLKAKSIDLKILFRLVRVEDDR
jgi:hypothetical protein